MAFKTINDTTSFNRLISTLLVFGAYPQIVKLNTLSPSVTQQANAIKKAIIKIQKLQAEHQVTNTLNMHNRLKTNVVHNLLLNSPILI